MTNITEYSSVQDIRESILKVFDKNKNSVKPYHKCDICFEQLPNATTFVSSLVIRKAFKYLFFINQEEGANLISIATCEICTNLFIDIVKYAEELEKTKQLYNNARKKVGRMLILGNLSKTEKDWEKWKREISNFEEIYPLRLIQMMTSDVRTETEKHYEDPKLHKMRAEVVLQRLVMEERPDYIQTSLIETDLKSEEEDDIIMDTVDTELHEFPLLFDALTQKKSEEIKFTISSNISTSVIANCVCEILVPLNTSLTNNRNEDESTQVDNTGLTEEGTYSASSLVNSDHESFEDIKEEDENTMIAINEWQSQVGKEPTTIENTGLKTNAVMEVTKMTGMSPPKLYQCLFCDKILSSTNQFVSHLEDMHKICKENISPNRSLRNYRCLSCNITFDLKESISHWKFFHQEFPCKKCQLKFKNENDLSDHLEKEHKDDTDTYKEKQTPAIIRNTAIIHNSSVRQLRKRPVPLVDLTDPEKDRSYSDASSSISSEDISNYEVSDLESEDEDFVLNACTEKTKSKQELHPGKTQERKTVDCPFCVKTLTNCTDNKTHLMKIHGIFLKTTTESTASHDLYACKGCKVSLNLQEALKHEKEFHESCPKKSCYLRFPSKTAFAVHYETAHGDIYSDSSDSSSCSEATRNLDWEKHWKLEKCTFCSAQRHSIPAYKAHLMTAHDMLEEKQTDNDDSGQQYTCTLCKISYNLEEAVRHEKTVHLKCKKGCLVRFSSREDATKHEKEVHGRLLYRRKRRELMKKNGIKCRHCTRVVSSVCTLKSHMNIYHREHVKKSNLPCTHCDLIFSDIILLRRHKFHAHRIGSSKYNHYQCDLCLKYFIDHAGRKKHKVRYHNWNPKSAQKSTDTEQLENIKCHICIDSPTYSSPEGLKTHEETEEHKNEVESRILVFCNICKKNFNGSLIDLKEHLETEDHKNEKTQLGDFDRETFCIPCRKSFESYDLLLQHERKDMDHRYTCKSFRELNLRDDEPFETPVICHACPKVFGFPKELKRHIRMCHPVHTFKCKLCTEQFSTWAELVMHRLCHTAKEKLFICEKCGKRFSSEMSLKMHMSSHHSFQSQQKCFECGRLFNSKTNLSHHTRTVHRGLKTAYDCPHCDFSAPMAPTLRKHLYNKHADIYLKDKPHYCSVCHYNFAEKEELDTHMISHKDNNVKCYFCGHVSFNLGGMETHLRKHTEERPFNCSLCQCWFKTNGNLTNHVNAIHKNQKRTVKENVQQVLK